MLANEFMAFEHSPLFFVDIIIHCSLLRTCRVRVEEKEEFLVYTVLWTLTCHPYLESATALSDKYTVEAMYTIPLALPVNTTYLPLLFSLSSSSLPPLSYSEALFICMLISSMICVYMHAITTNTLL